MGFMKLICFFDNAFLIELIYKYKDFFKLDQESQESEIFWVKNDKILQGNLELCPAF